jgi:hypothetical protein
MREQEIGHTSDVVALLVAQHVEIKLLFGRVIAERGAVRRDSFRELCRLLTVHEAGEEAIVHPAATRAIPRGDGIVGTRLREEHAAKAALARLETLDPDSKDFDTEVRALAMHFFSHAEREELEEFDKLRRVVSEDRLVRMASAVQRFQAGAPTHPHPGAEPAATLAGPFDGIMDRARDAIAIASKP